MKKFDSKKMMQNKNIRFGGYATIVTAVLIAILIVVNLVVAKLEVKVDLTTNKMFTLQEQTQEVVRNLGEEVHIYALYEAGKEDKTITEILQKYPKISNKVVLEYKDPVLYPQFVNAYKKDGQDISAGSVIVEAKGRNKYKVISRYDLVNWSQGAYGQQPQAESLAVEQRVTGAISYVTSDKDPQIYVLEGHKEASLDTSIRQQLERENYAINTLNLMTEQIEASDLNTLVIVAPQQDLTEDEYNKIMQFLGQGGRCVFLNDFNLPTLPNFNKILERYGVEYQQGVVIEADKSKIVQYPMYLLPTLENHEINNPIKLADVPVLVPNSMSIKILDEKNRNTEISPLLTTSDQAYLKTNPNAQTIEFEEGDVKGAQTVAVAIEESNYNDSKTITTKLIVAGSAQFVNPPAVPGNLDFIMNSFKWLQDEQQSDYIRPVSLQSERLNMTNQQALIYSGLFVIILPLIILIYGIYVWMRRRHL